MHARDELGEMLNARGLVGEGVEVGVWRGDFALSILDRWKGRCLHLVDPWAPQTPTEYRDILNVSTAAQDANFRFTMEQLREHTGRFKVHRQLSRQAADQFADSSLDFAYIDANHAYRTVQEDLRLWRPKIVAGGILAGHDYLEGTWHGTEFGVRRAVQEFAAAIDAVVHVTLDPIPSWWMAIPSSKHRTSPGKIAVLTCYDQDMAEVGRISSANKRSYCERHRYDFIEETEALETGRPPTWWKIKLLQKHLPSYDWIFWTDADSLVMNPSVRLERFLTEDSDMVICHEDVGQGVYNINAGQFLIRRSDWSFEFLEAVWDQERFVHDRLGEQRAIIHLLFSYNLSQNIRILSQREFNSYILNYAGGDFLLHLADMSNEQRVSLMRRHFNKMMPKALPEGRLPIRNRTSQSSGSE